MLYLQYICQKVIMNNIAKKYLFRFGLINTYMFVNCKYFLERETQAIYNKFLFFINTYSRFL